MQGPGGSAGQAEPSSGSCLGIPGRLLVWPVGGCKQCLCCGEAGGSVDGTPLGVPCTEHGLDTDAVMHRVILCRGSVVEFQHL